MKYSIDFLLKQPTPLPSNIADRRANCFNAVQLYWADCFECKMVRPEEFVAYIQENFKQADISSPIEVGDVTIIWSRTSSILPRGNIQIERPRKDHQGYPFDLVIEQAFVSTSEDRIFQKRDPTANGPYERITYQAAIDPYLAQTGFEETRHRRK